MASNTSNNTYTKSSDEYWLVVPNSGCVPWFFVLVTESLAIITLNTISIVVFAKQHKQQSQGTYLIIHLAMVDLVIGAVNGPLNIYTMGNFCDLWEHDMRDINWIPGKEYVLVHIAHLVSFFNLAIISLERAHATFRPFKHRLAKKWVYGMITAVVWSVPVAIIPIRELIPVYDLRGYIRRNVMYFYYYFIFLFVISVSYLSIYIKVRCSRHPQRHGAAGLRERKLTSTLFLVTVVSFLMFLPVVVLWGVVGFNSEVLISLPFQLNFHIFFAMKIFLLANSVVNPIIYAVRMPALRARISHLLCRKAPNRLKPVDIPIRGL